MAKGEQAGNRLLLGEIGAAHGLRGEVRLKSYTQNPADIAAYGPLFDEAGMASFEIAHLRGGPKGLIATFKGVSDRSAAERLTGTRLYVGRDVLPGSEPDEWYYADLIGLAAVDPQGEALGTVLALHNFGAGDLLELALIEPKKPEPEASELETPEREPEEGGEESPEEPGGKSRKIARRGRQKPKVQKTVLVPFTQETVPEIDIDQGRITIAMPEGLLE